VDDLAFYLIWNYSVLRLFTDPQYVVSLVPDLALNPFDIATAEQ